MSVPSRADRIRGSLLGLAVGDALGAPLEGLSDQQIRHHYGLVTDFVDGAKAWKKKPFRWRLPGLYTDDTQQALALVDVLLATGEVDVERLARIYLDLATPDHGHAGAHRGVGASFRHVLAALRGGACPRTTGQPSAGIGAAMRIAPVGLYFADDPEGLFDAVMAASLMTHRDIRSLSAAMAVALAAVRLLDDPARSASFLFRLAADVQRAEDRIDAQHGRVVASLGAYRRSVSDAIAHVESVLELPRDRAIAAILDEANRHGPNSPLRRPTQGFPPALLPTCLYLLVTSDSLEEALVDAVNLGGDADSAGAILGALGGLVFGARDLPRRWLRNLHNVDGIEARAEALHRKSARGLEIPDLIAREHELTAREAANREALLSHPPYGGDRGASRV